MSTHSADPTPRFETVGNILRALTTTAAWVIVALLGVVGKIVWDDRVTILETQRRLTELIHNHDVRLSVLEAQRQANEHRNGEQY